jgi:hypothetical protein
VLAGAELSGWCGQALGSRPARILFRSGHLTQVTDVSLADGSSAVIKVRPIQPRIRGCVAVQAHLAGGRVPLPGTAGRAGRGPGPRGDGRDLHRRRPPAAGLLRDV